MASAFAARLADSSIAITSVFMCTFRAGGAKLWRKPAESRGRSPSPAQIGLRSRVPRAAAMRPYAGPVIDAPRAVRMKILVVLPDVLMVLMAIGPIGSNPVLILAQVLAVVMPALAILVQGHSIVAHCAIVLPQRLAIASHGGGIATLAVGAQGVEILPALSFCLLHRAPILVRLTAVLAQVGAVVRDVLSVALDVAIILAQIGAIARDVAPVLANIAIVLPDLLIVLAGIRGLSEDRCGKSAAYSKSD